MEVRVDESSGRRRLAINVPDVGARTAPVTGGNDRDSAEDDVIVAGWIDRDDVVVVSLARFGPGYVEVVQSQPQADVGPDRRGQLKQREAVPVAVGQRRVHRSSRSDAQRDPTRGGSTARGQKDVQALRPGASTISRDEDISELGLTTIARGGPELQRVVRRLNHLEDAARGRPDGRDLRENLGVLSPGRPGVVRGVKTDVRRG